MAYQRKTRQRFKLPPSSTNNESDSSSTTGGLESCTCEYCHELIEQENLKAHMETECPHRLEQCPDCGSIDRIGSGHECPRLRCQCNNTSDHEQHCPLYKVACEFAVVGCKKKVRRSKASSHNMAYMTRHLRGAIGRIDSLNEHCIAIHSNIDDHTDRLNKLEKDHDELDQRMTATENDVKKMIDMKNQASEASEVKNLQKQIKIMDERILYHDDYIAGLRNQITCLTAIIIFLVLIAVLYITL